MKFVHEDDAFQELIAIVAGELRLTRGLVEKDYWVTHALWALQDAGFEVWFKGGTSLSKGFDLIQRFSEDLDLKVEPGGVGGMPRVSNWKSDGKKATAERRAYFTRLAELLPVAGATVALDPDAVDPTWRGANLRVEYPCKHQHELGIMLPFVRLEVGVARVTPFLQRDMTSFVHEKLAQLGELGKFRDNRPRGMRCVHPLVTLLEKLDAIRGRFPKPDREPAAFVRNRTGMDAVRARRSRDSLGA